MGATNFGYELAKRFGHSIVPTYPALVPLTFSADDLARYQDLTGIGLPVEASCNGQSFSAPMLFTHRGISGPAILQISSYWKPGEELRVNLLPGIDAMEWLLERQQSRPAAELKTVLGETFPKRLAQRLSEIDLTAGRCASIAPRNCGKLPPNYRAGLFIPSARKGIALPR